MSFDRSLQEDLFGEEHIHKALESRDVMDPQGGAREDQKAEDSTPELEPYSNDSAALVLRTRMAMNAQQSNQSVALWTRLFDLAR